jgi:hypothetical protein
LGFPAYHAINQPRAEREIANAAFWILEQSKSDAAFLGFCRSRYKKQPNP